MIRVGRKKGNKCPSYPGFKTIQVMMKSYSKWHELSPYELNDKGQFLKNIWQFSKVYEGTVPKSVQKYSRFDPTVIWEFKKHIQYDPKSSELTDDYLEWRKQGFNNLYAVRYPVGFKFRSNCLFAIKDINEDEIVPLDYIESRKEIYSPLYKKFARKEPLYTELLNMLKKGTKLLIVEVDGPHTETLPYYQKQYDVPDNFIENDTMLATKENLDIMLNDTKHPYGHGYCLASALLEDC